MSASSKQSLKLTPNQTYGEAARAMLHALLNDVLHYLRLAAESSGTDEIEHVHKLRVATRRSGVALKSFGDLIGDGENASLRETLRRIRKAADGARNSDVLAERFLSGNAPLPEDLRAKLKERFRRMRDAAQKPIESIHRELADGDFVEEVQALLDDVRARRPERADVPFGKQAGKILVPILKKFFKTARRDSADPEELHRIRIEAKKLRYTMEIVASAFSPDFKNKLLREFCRYQDVMGEIRDHAIAEELLCKWLSEPCDASEREFLEGLLLTETHGCARKNADFKLLWTEKAIHALQDEFANHLGARFRVRGRSNKRSQN